jgi:PEP-CTERM motif
MAVCVAFALAGTGTPAYADLVITPTFDNSITSDPNAAAIEGTINSAIGIYESTYSNPINVTIYFQEGGGLGTSIKALYGVNYSDFRAALASEYASSGQSDQGTALAHLPNQVNNPVTGNPTMALSTANIKALGGPGLPGVTVGGQNYDGQIILNTALTFPGSPGSALLVGLSAVVKHEIDEVLGLGSSLAQSFQQFPSAGDLYRYDQNGNRSYTTDPSAQAYFSINGTTRLAQFDNQNDGGDWGDWQSNPLPVGAQPQVQDAFATVGANPQVGVELTALDVIGYTRTAVAAPEPSTLAIAGLGGILTLGYTLLRRRRSAT